MDLITHTFETPHGQPIVMAYREGTVDWNILTSSLTEDEYLLPAGISGTALDIGGYLGSVGIALALDNPDLVVTIVEPVPPNLALIHQNVWANGVQDRVVIRSGAVGRAGASVRVDWAFEGDETATHHAFVGNALLVQDAVHTTTEYPALTIGDLAESDVAFTKIDTEGAEYDFLDDPAVNQLQVIAGEWHNNDGHVIGDILKLLDETHVVTFTGPQRGPGGFRAERR